MGYASTYNVEISNPELQLNVKIKDKLKDLLTEIKRFKFVATLLYELKKIERDDATKHSNFYSVSKAETVINESDIIDVFESIYSTIVSNIQKSLAKSLGWIIDSVVDHNINISKCKPLSGSIYIKLPKELDHIEKGFINIQNINLQQGLEKMKKMFQENLILMK